MKAALMLFVAMSVAAVRAAVPVSIDAPGLLPTQVARPLLDQDPGVSAARAGLDVARQEAGLLDRSPYDWIARFSSQRRSLQAGPRYQEWNAGIERTLRLPGKALADRDLGKATVEEAEARFGEVLHEAARDLLTLWIDWLQAERGRELSVVQRTSVQENLSAVEKRARAGDASKLDVSLAQAELAELQRADNDAQTQAVVAWGRLNARFPGIERKFDALPTPQPLKNPLIFWRERILAESDELKGAQAQLEKAQALAARARADKLPDPTLGLHTSSEVGGTERVTGITLTIPLPSGPRNGRAAKAGYAAEVARQEVAQKKRQLESEIVAAVATTEGSFTSLQIADAGAAAMQDNARLVQRAYALGEADLQSLLAARRQATNVAQAALAARVAAVKAYYLLLVDARLVWDLKHD